MSFYADLKNSEVSISGEDDHRIRAQFSFRRQLELFKGHFPGNPILPGIMQIEMVKYILEKSLKTCLCLHSIKKTKFSNLIHPDEVVEVDITIDRTQQGFLAAKAIVKTQQKIAGKTNLILTENKSD